MLRLHRQQSDSEELESASTATAAHLRAYETFFTCMPVQLGASEPLVEPLPLSHAVPRGASGSQADANNDVGGTQARTTHGGGAGGGGGGGGGARFVMCNVGTMARCVALQSGITRVLAHVARASPELLRGASALWAPLCRQLADAPPSLRTTTLDALRVLLGAVDDVDVDVHVILPPLVALLELCPRHAVRLAVDR